ncbi:MAG: methyltransferase domain-containing protein [Puniceicoccaceae bacterium]
MTDALAQHSREIAETRACWSRKPLLREAYRNFHREIRSRLARGGGATVELGSGIGAIKETIPFCVTTDVFENPMVDRIEDAYSLTFPDGSVANLILFDVWHHLEFPASAMEEFRRVLEPGGRLILFEPAALSLLGRLVFGCFHHEPVHGSGPLRWRLPEDQPIRELPYYAAQGNAWKMFGKREPPGIFGADWHCREVAFFPAFDWLAAGGFRARQLAPSWLGRPLRWLSGAAAFCPRVFATRMLVCLEKKMPTAANASRDGSISSDGSTPERIRSPGP